MSPEIISQSMSSLGLMVRGGFHPTPSDGVPEFPSGEPVATVMMVGNAGPAMWQMFSRAPERSLKVDPLNTWTRRVIDETIPRMNALAIYPFDGPPYYPFQRWAQRADSVWSSPIGILIHPEYGLWHGYRAALLFKEHLSINAPVGLSKPCEQCAQQPCLTTCPVNAFSADGYDVKRCVEHISTDVGSDCISRGCRARRSCPVGADFCYDSPQADFHQRAFLRSHKRPQVNS